jgi:hypothetical protein
MNRRRPYPLSVKVDVPAPCAQIKFCYPILIIHNENDRGIGEEFDLVLREKFQSGRCDHVDQINMFSVVLTLQQPDKLSFILLGRDSEAVLRLVEELEVGGRAVPECRADGLIHNEDARALLLF